MMPVLTLLLLCAALLGGQRVHGERVRSLKNEPDHVISQATSYLARFGYTSPSPTQDRSTFHGTLSDGIAEFQAFAGLNVTGILDNDTKDLMTQPRCGHQDITGPSLNANRRKRFILLGRKRIHKHLTYKIINLPTKIPHNMSEISDMWQQVTKAWSDVCDFTFEEVREGKADITIRFAAGKHGKCPAFDGPGGVLAHASKNIHFDDDEQFVLDISKAGKPKIMLLQVSVHELGHILGLGHSKDNTAVMFPYYGGPRDDRHLVSPDDVAAVQMLYGPPAAAEATVPPTTSTVSPTELAPYHSTVVPAVKVKRHDTMTTTPESFCRRGVVANAMLTVEWNGDHQTFVFFGRSYWRLTDTGVEDGFPLPIKHMWDGVPNDLDTIFHWKEKNQVFFFKGDLYWRMTNLTMDSDYPKSIAEGFARGIPAHIDAVARSSTGDLAFFKDDMFYWVQMGWIETGKSKKSPPFSIGKFFGGIPSNMDYSFVGVDGSTYLFKGNDYFKIFVDTLFLGKGTVSIQIVKRRFPDSAKQDWFGCDEVLEG